MPGFNTLAEAFVLALCLRLSSANPHHPAEEKDVDPTCRVELIVTDKKTVWSTEVIPTTVYEDHTISRYVNTTITKSITECITKTVHFTVALTDTEHDTVSKTETDTVSTTETTTDTVATTETETKVETTTKTVPATITTYSTETIFSTSYDPCPKSCSVDAATVTVFYWPTDRPHSYPATYVDEDMDYTFTSPSVYLIIPSAKGTNTKGQWVGPSTTNWILGLDIQDVSTIADGPSGSLTRQLQLSDLGTDCPQTMDPTAIATLSDSRCAPILAAPTQVSSWAYPCNACGPFGLFDPPYAVPTVTGGIVKHTSTMDKESASDVKSTPEPSPEPVTSPKSEEDLATATTTFEPSSAAAGEGSVPTIEPSSSNPAVNPVPPDLPSDATTPMLVPSDVPTPGGPSVTTAAAYKLSSTYGWALTTAGVLAVIMTCL